MLKTQITLKLVAGKGGNGKVSFYKNWKGPDGGNGGKGGDIYIVGGGDTYALGKLASKRKIKAQDGENGSIKNITGKDAPDLEIKLPRGTEITNLKTGGVSRIEKGEDRFLICKGGAGGRGNWEFRSPTNTTPEEAEEGFPGQEKEVLLNLKLIADYGLVGLPNAGKSSLLKELTNANPKIANYPFTTIEPNLGELNGKIVADIPGLISGASQGKGLGVAFLKHIEKVSLILHCISAESGDIMKDYNIIRAELGNFNSSLLKVPETILITKHDLIEKSQLKELIKKLSILRIDILPVSIHDFDSIEQVKKVITDN